MRFVTVKSAEKQASGMALRTRDLLVRQKTQTINALRGHLAEYGLVAPSGTVHLNRLQAAISDPETELPAAVIDHAQLLLDHIEMPACKIDKLGAELRAGARQDPAAKRLMTIPGIGPITAMALTALSLQTQAVSAKGGTSPPGPGSRPSNSHRAAKSVSGARRKWASATCAAFLSSVRRLSCDGPFDGVRIRVVGSGRCWHVNQGCS